MLSIVQGSNQVYQDDLDYRARKANMRDFFAESDTKYIQTLLRTDLDVYYKDTSDIFDLRLITLDYFLPEFLSKLSNVYNEPPKIVVGGTEDNQIKFNDLMRELGVVQFLDDTLKKMKLHNTVIPYVQYHKALDKITLENGLNIGTCKTWAHPSHYTELDIVSYPQYDKYGKVFYVIWHKSKNEHYVTYDTPKYDPASHNLLCQKTPIGVNDSVSAPNVFPFTVYRYKNHGDFWGNGLDSAIELIRTVNTTLTILQDVTELNTMGLLYLPFEPEGTKDSEGRLKTGFRNPIFKKARIDGHTSGAIQYVQGRHQTKEIMDYVMSLVDTYTATYNISNILKSKLQDTHGVSLKIQNQPFLRRWQEDINIVERYDREFIKKIVAVHNDFRIDNIDASELDIQYSKPKTVTDEKMDYELLKEQFKDGTASIVEWVKAQQNFETLPDARKWIEENVETMIKLFGEISPPSKEEVRSDNQKDLIEYEYSV